MINFKYFSRPTPDGQRAVSRISQSITTFLAPSVWKFLQNIPLDMRDIYVFDPQLASSYQQILLSSNVESMDIYFDDNETQVTDSNKKEYIKQQSKQN